MYYIWISCSIKDTSLSSHGDHCHTVFTPCFDCHQVAKIIISGSKVFKKWLAPLAKQNRGTFHTWLTPAGLHTKSHQAASVSLLLQAKPFFALRQDHIYSQSHLIVFIFATISEQWDPGLTSLRWTCWVDWIEMSADSFIKRDAPRTDGARRQGREAEECLYMSTYICLHIVMCWYCTEMILWNSCI